MPELIKTVWVLLFSVPLTMPDVNLQEDNIKPLYEALENAGEDSEKLQKAWLPILQIINQAYWCNKFETEKIKRVQWLLGKLIAAEAKCLKDIEASGENRRLAEQMALLSLTIANAIRLIPSGHLASSSQFPKQLDAAGRFIAANHLENSKAHALLHYLEASYALQNGILTKGHIEIDRKNLEGEQEQDKKEEYIKRMHDNETSLEAWIALSIQHFQESLRIYEDVLKTSFKDGEAKDRYKYTLLAYAEALVLTGQESEYPQIEDVLNSIIKDENEKYLGWTVDRALIARCKEMKNKISAKASSSL